MGLDSLEDDTHLRYGRHDYVAISRRAIEDLPEVPAVIIALQIRWEDDIAYRVTIAETGEEAWKAAMPTKKLIVLM